MVDTAASARVASSDWTARGDEQLLDVRMCDLALRIEGTDLEQRIAQINAELDARGLRFRPHYWLADEWFTPDGVPGVAIPFYLAHPRLARLELAQMLEVEGGDPDSCLRILRHEVDPLRRLKKTLREHYRRKREHYGLDHPDFYDRDLRNLFSDSPEYAKNLPAARFVRKIRKDVRGRVASFTDSYQYTIDQLLEKVIERCRELNLRLMDSEEETKTDFMVFLTVQTMNYLHSGRHRVAL